MSISIVGVLIFVLVVALVWWIIGLIPLPPMGRRVVLIIFGIVLILFLLQFAGYGPGIRITA
jgi:hypothetical protein